MTVVRAVIPLVGEWDTVTTAQIARAAGIAEEALLAVFADKEAVLQASIEMMRANIDSALDPTEVLHDLAAVSPDQPLAARLVAAVGALDTYHGRMITLLAPMDASGPESTPGEPRPRKVDRDDPRSPVRSDAISQALTRLIEPDQGNLRLPAETLADAFLGLHNGRKRTRDPAQPDLPAEQFVDLFLHGALHTPKPA